MTVSIKSRRPGQFLGPGYDGGPRRPRRGSRRCGNIWLPPCCWRCSPGSRSRACADSSVTGDEVAHLPAGYTYVRTGDFRLNPQHPPLVKALAGAPLLLLDLAPVDRLPGWTEADEWVFGRAFLTANRAPMERILLLARLPMVAIGVVLGAVLFLWARDLWGRGAGLFVLLLYVLCPNLLGHTALVTTDVGVSCFTVFTLYALWRLVRGGPAARCGAVRHRARSRAAREVHRSGDRRAGSGPGRSGRGCWDGARTAVSDVDAARECRSH